MPEPNDNIVNWMMWQAQWQCSELNDNVAGTMTTQWAERWQHGPNDNNTGPTTTTQAQQQQHKPNNNTASWTMMWQAQWWWHKPNDDARSHLHITHSKFVEDCSAGTTPLICMSCSYVPPVASYIFLKYIYFTAKCQLRPVKTSHEPVKTITG